MTRFTAVLAVLAAVHTSSLIAQGPPGGQGGPTPLPDHWLTIDSVATALTLSSAQRTNISEAYTALNAVMKEAAAKRQAVRDLIQKEMAGRTFADMSDADRARMRAIGDSVRPELEAMQAEADQWHAAIRSNLSPEQQAKFDALPKPVVFRQMMRRGGGD